MGRKSQEATLTSSVTAYLEAVRRNPAAYRLDVKSVAVALGVSRTSLYKYGLDRMIREARQQQEEMDEEPSNRLSDVLAQLRQELKVAEQRNKALLTRLNMIEANAARLGIDPEELYRPLPKPMRAVSHAGRHGDQTPDV
jgi:hypothetical protein